MRLVVQDPARIVGVTSHVTIAEDPERSMAAPEGRRPIDRNPFMVYQHLDYLRAFFNNRLAWSRLGFMLCSVGAFQIWRRDVLEEVGGYSRTFTCEDIELTFRVHERFLARRRHRPAGRTMSHGGRPTSPLGDAVETFVRREDAERFVAEVRGDDPELAGYLRIEQRELEAGGRN